jgi:hypothetical protein
MKTIILSESQVKNVIGRILTEQTIVRNEVRKPASLPPINIPYKFPAGYWLPTKNLISQVTNSLDPIIEFIRQHQSQKIEVSIQAGESQVTNADNEPSSKNKGKTVPQKYLANNRANSVKTIIDNYFDNLIKNNVISVKPTFIENQIVIGSTPYQRGVNKPNDPKYSEEQFINVIVNATGESVTIEETCLVGLRLMIDYNKDWCKPNDQSRCHACNKAVFSIYANGVPIKDANGSNIIDLNNEGSGDSRKWIGIFSETDSKAVLQGGKKEIIITYQCEYEGGEGCHSDAMHVTIFDNTNKQIFSNFVSGGYRVKKSDGQRLLLKTDQCGRVTEVAPRATSTQSQPKPKRTIQKWDMDYNDVITSAAKVYLTVDEQGMVHPEKLFDPIYDRSNLAFWAKNIKTWKDFLYQYEDEIRPSDMARILKVANSIKNNTKSTQSVPTK